MLKKITIALVFSFFVFSLPTHASAQSFTFGAAGDFANGSNFAATVDTIKVQNPNFFLSLGDFSYTAGAEPAWCNKWKTTFTNVVFLTGNHDSGENTGGNITNYLSNCPPYPLTSTLTGQYGHQYYFDYPSNNPIARFIMIRPGLGGNNVISYTVGSPGYVFTQNAIDDARTKGIKWVIVGMHKNYITIQQKDNEVGTDLMTMLFDKKVDLILQGHEHGYQRTKQLSCATTDSYTSSCVADSDNTYVKGAGSVINILGTGGQGLRWMDTTDVEYPYFAKVDNLTYGFGKFTVSSTQLSYSFVRSAGETLTDSYVINASITSTPTSGISPSTTPTRTPTLVVTSTLTSTLTPTRTSTVTPSKTSTPGVTRTPTLTITPTTTTSQSSICTADITGDNFVDLSDYSLLVRDFLKSPPSNPKTDIDGSGVVDLLDYSILVRQFLKTCTPKSSPTFTINP